MKNNAKNEEPTQESSSTEVSSEEQLLSEESSTLYSEISTTSSEIEINVIVEENININDYEIFLEQTRLFTSTNELNENVLKCVSAKSGDAVLSFLMLLKYDKLLKIIPKNLKKTINKTIETNIEALTTQEDRCEEVKRTKEDIVEKIKKKIVLVYTERICDLDPLQTLELYKKMDIDGDYIYLIFSKLEQINKFEREEVMKDFSDFEKEHFDFLPSRIEEIFLLKVTTNFKMTKINGKDHRIFLLTPKNIQEFIKLLENEIK